MVKAFKPHPRFPSISITGGWCELSCDFCRARVLRSMLWATTPSELYQLCEKLKRKGAFGVLISGGFTKECQLPLQPFSETLRAIKEGLGLFISVHACLVDEDYAAMLRESRVDLVDLSLYDENVLRSVMGVKAPPVSVEETLENLHGNGPFYVVPHVLAGAAGGKITTEKGLLDTLTSYDPYLLVFLVLMPVKGTPVEALEPPAVEDVVELVKYARKKLPKAEISLGCMRPRGAYSVELERRLMEEELIDRIALPKSFKPKAYLESCCSLPEAVLKYKLLQPSYEL